ncbi:hypothetical protein DVH24_013250 [Malus domestica]|uniref:Uncharacterized protein n=1 Tax=Malus domestica TaxID=3750 RepID=A0A498HJK1_MALDO|nr:hypothetical protein DVH24_013250 [Malus domestica]
MSLVGAIRSHRVRSAGLAAMVQDGTIRSHGDKLRVIGSRGAGKHDYERRAEAGLGQVVHNRKTWTTRFLMLRYW